MKSCEETDGVMMLYLPQWIIPSIPFTRSYMGNERTKKYPVPIDTNLSKGMSGSVLPNPDCIPGSTYYCPLTSVGLPDIKNDRSLSVLYFFPKQLTPHRSVMLPGAKRPMRILSGADLEVTRNGGRGRGRGGWDRGGNSGRGNGMDRSRNDPFHGRSNNYGQQSYANGRGGGGNSNGNGRGGYGNSYGGGGDHRGGYGNSYQQNQYPSRAPYQSPPPSNSYGNSGNNYSGYGGRGGYNNGPSHPRGNSNGYQSYNSGSRGGYNAPPPQNSYSSYGNDMNGGNSYSGNGGYGGYGGYDGYGGYGSGNASNSAPPRGGAPYNSNPSRGRGRGW
ncbi:hypothetical protein CPC08DRAFT_181000 [Agrocybe pediades]|nr:hypothetical protein CPC08DRAFT_181000 [Agrocybe pediades]